MHQIKTVFIQERCMGHLILNDIYVKTKVYDELTHLELKNRICISDFFGLIWLTFVRV